MKYRKFVDEVDAIQFLDNTKRLNEISEFLGEAISVDYYYPAKPMLTICSHNIKVPLYDYIVRFRDGYSIWPAVRFEDTYERVAE